MTPDRSDLRLAAIVHSLRETSLFSGLPEEDLLRIAGYSRLRPLRKDEYLFRENDPATGFFVIRRGIINVHRTAADGREQVIHLFRPGESLAELALIGTKGYPADARAVASSEVILIPTREFMDHQRHRTDLAWRMVAAMSHHLRVLVSTLDNLRLKDAETRLLHWLLRRCPTDAGTGFTIDLGMTKALLASEIGTRQETLSRIFSRLRDAGLLEVERQALTLPDPQALREEFERHLSGRED